MLVSGDSILVHAIAESPAEGLKTGDMDRQVTAMEGLTRRESGGAP
jgi:hypothetical protein